MSRKVSLHIEFMKILTLTILIQFDLHVRCTYCLFCIVTTSDAYPVLNLCVPPVRRSTTELDSVGVDIIN